MGIGFYLSCNADGFEAPLQGDRENISLGVGEYLAANCKSAQGKKYDLWFLGVGPGLRISNGAFVLSCPLLNRNRLERRGEMGFVGAKVTAAAILGVSTAVMINQRLGVCLLTGLEVGVGASVGIGLVKIESVNGNEQSF